MSARTKRAPSLFLKLIARWDMVRSSVRRILKREGPRTSKNLRGTKIRMKRIVPLKFSPIFCPKLGEEQKKKEKGLHSNLV